MNCGNYKFAGHTVRIESMYGFIHKMCADYVSEESIEATITISQEDIDFETERNSEEKERTGVGYSFYPAYLETLAVYRKLATLMLDWDVLLFHASAVAVDGRCYLFTAKSGTGKSTHVRLWRKLLGSRVMMVNDDKPLLGITPQGVMVYGTPWDGKHHLSTNTAVPLQAICLVTRGETNSCKEIKPDEILIELLNQSFISRDPLKRLIAINLINKLSKQIKFYKLSCNMELEAAQVSYRAMAPQSIEDILRFDKNLMHHVKGISMEPMLKQGRDLLVVEPEKPIQNFDVVLFKRRNGKYVLHRVTEIHPDHYIITGDNCMKGEVVYPDQILGVMTSFIRKGVQHSISEPAYQQYVKIWHSTYALRFCYNISTRAWRRLKSFF